MKSSFWLGIVISLVLVATLTYGIDFAELLTVLSSVSYLPLIGAVVVLCSTQFIKSWRWKYLLASVKLVKASELLSPTVIGAMADMIFPARIGELVRAYLTGRKQRVSTVATLATIVIEKVFDIVILLLIAGCLLLLPVWSLGTNVPRQFASGVLLVMAIIVPFVIFLGLLMVRTSPVIAVVRRVLRFLPNAWLQSVVARLYSFAQGLQSVRDTRNLIPVIILSILLWATYASSNYMILEAFELQLPFYASFVFLVFQILGVTLPSSPGFIGTYHAAVVAGFSIFHVTQENALSVAIVMHAAFFFPFVAMGIIFLWWENLSLSTIWSARHQVVGND